MSRESRMRCMVRTDDCDAVLPILSQTKVIRIENSIRSTKLSVQCVIELRISFTEHQKMKCKLIILGMTLFNLHWQLMYAPKR